MARHHTAIGVTAYAERPRLLRDETVSDLRGVPERKPMGGKACWYDRYRPGDRTVDRYIGEDTPAWRKRIVRSPNRMPAMQSLLGTLPG